MARRCPDCGTEAMPSDRACLRCGTPLPSGLGRLFGALFGQGRADNHPTPPRQAPREPARPFPAKAPSHQAPGRAPGEPSRQGPAAAKPWEGAGVEATPMAPDLSWEGLLGPSAQGEAGPSSPAELPVESAPQAPSGQGAWRGFAEVQANRREAGDPLDRFAAVRELMAKTHKPPSDWATKEFQLDLPKRLLALSKGESPFPGRSPWLAPIASYVFPGLGQALQGRWRLGLGLYLGWHFFRPTMHTLVGQGALIPGGELLALLWDWGPTAVVGWAVYEAHRWELRHRPRPPGEA